MSRLSSIPHYLEEFRLLGVRGSIFRISHETKSRIGLYAHRQPIEELGASRWRRSWLGVYPKDLLDFWRSNRPKFFVDPSSISDIFAQIERFTNKDNLRSLKAQAESSRDGQIRCFSKWTADFGNPIDWHLNPKTGARWPAQVHWSQVLVHEAECGDVKLSWEIGRFPQAFIFVRAWAADGDSRWVRAFFDQVRSWEMANPYRAGIHWVSGQEAAIRACAWLFALYAFGNSPEMAEEDIQRMTRLLFLHAEHIEANIDFAKLSVRNNHLIGESLALYLIGSYFPWFRESARWKDLGRKLLLEDCAGQFFPDGGYCQSSHTYHRLALQYYIWALRSAECLREPFPSKLYDLAVRSKIYLGAFINEDGRLPNWGANDGACLHPLTYCDYTDFRPLIDSLSLLTTGKRSFPTGPWNEELLWLWGPGATDAPISKKDAQPASFPVSGLHVLRSGPGDYAVLRCGNVQDRFGHADQLHADIWWRGLNIAQDGGSYLYNDEAPFHRHFMSAASHNTVTVDGTDQMLLYRRFKWLYWTQAKLLKWLPEAAIPEVSGEHYGYQRLPGKILHQRTIRSLSLGRWDVLDELVPSDGRSHAYQLQWLLGVWPAKVEDHSVIFTTEKGRYRISCTWESPQDSSPQNEFSLVKGIVEPQPRGWTSRYYGEKEEVRSAIINLSARGPVRFRSEFSPE